MQKSGACIQETAVGVARVQAAHYNEAGRGVYVGHVQLHRPL